MAIQKHASAVWNGGLKDGSGMISTQSGSLEEAAYSVATRFEGQEGTNPEELIAAAHSACYSMALSAFLGGANFTPNSISTTATVTVDKDGDGWSITKSELVVEADIPDIDDAQFQEIAANAKANCPVSKLLNAEVTLQATLASPATV